MATALLKNWCARAALLAVAAAAAGCQTLTADVMETPEARLERRLAQAAAGEPQSVGGGDLLASGRARIAAGDAEGAVAPLRRHVDARPDDVRGLLALAAAYDLAGRPAEAAPYYDRAERLAPDDPAVLNNKGLSLALAGRLEESARLLRRASMLSKAPAKVKANLALVEDLRREEKAP